MTWTLGQQVVIVRYAHSRDVRIDDGEIIKIGRKWLTVKAGWSEERFGFDGSSEHTWGYPARLWVTRSAYEAEVERCRLWGELRKVVGNHPPKATTIEAIKDAIALLTVDSNKPD